MNRVHIVTDSNAQFLTPGFPADAPVTVVPVPLILDQREHVLSTMEPDGWRRSFEDPETAPRSGAPSVDEMTTVYNRIYRETDSILSLHVSASVAATWRNAEEASRTLLGRCDIQVIDSQMISVGLGLLVEAAAHAAAAGEPLDEVVRQVRGMIPRLYVVFFLDNLLFLERQGLVSRSQAILGNMLGVIPFLTMEEGHLQPMEKVRSRPRAIEKLIEFVSEFSDLERIAVLYDPGSMRNEARSVAERLRALYSETPISAMPYEPLLATYIGLNGLGVVVLESEAEEP